MNNRVFSILSEAAKSHNCSKAECGEACDKFADTIGNGHNFSDVIVPNGIKLNADTMPICKGECKDECGKMCEAYFIDGRLLDIYMSDNGINNDAEAVNNICEYYNIDVNDVYVVVESDEVNNSLIEHTRQSNSYGLLARCDEQICNCIENGIKVVKRS